SRGASGDVRAAHGARLLDARGSRGDGCSGQHRSKPPAARERSAATADRARSRARGSPGRGIMNYPVDVHPEDLLDDERSGDITPSALARLNAHTAICAPCALVRAATRDFEIERRISAADAALAARISLAAMDSAPAFAGSTSGAHSTFVRSRRRRGRRAWAVGAIMLFAATGSAASFWSVRHVIVSRLLVKAPTQAPLPEAAQKESPAPRAASAGRAESPRIEFVAPPVEPVAPAPQPRLAPPVVGSPPI